MKILYILALTFTANFVAEASLFPRYIGSSKDRIESRRRRKKVNSVKAGDGPPKYFHEPGGSPLANHYDSRYEHGVLSYEEKQDTQVHMMRAYLDFFKKNGVETWLAHGTLLGWWWNAKMLPWDWDIDTQVSGPTLMYLGKYLNGSIYDYNSKDSDPDTEPVVERQYLLDVNTDIVNRDRGNGNNVIDARWIDLRNGLYIDVTGVFETEPVDHPGIWTCKNYHHYKTTDLYPMRETMYEGVVARVPYAYDRILSEEYQEKALVVTEYEGHKWHPEFKEWVKKSPAEIKQERLDRQEARRKKIEEKAAQKKEKQEKAEQAHQEARIKAEAKEAQVDGDAMEAGLEEQVQDDHGIKEPEKEPHKRRRQAGLDLGTDDMPVLEKETSGLKHLRRRKPRHLT